MVVFINGVPVKKTEMGHVVVPMDDISDSDDDYGEYDDYGEHTNYKNNPKGKDNPKNNPPNDMDCEDDYEDDYEDEVSIYPCAQICAYCEKHLFGHEEIVKYDGPDERYKYWSVHKECMVTSTW